MKSKLTKPNFIILKNLITSTTGFINKKSLFFATLLLFIGANEVKGQVNIIPKLYLTAQNTPSGNSGWSITNAAINNATTDYWKMINTNASLVSPAMDLNFYSAESMIIKLGTFGTVNATKQTITASISLNNGSSWTIIGTRTPTGSSSSAMTAFDLSSYSGTQVKVKFEVLAGDTTTGVRFFECNITGTQNVNGTIASNEYGTHTDGNNQQSSATGTWYMTSDAANLYVGISGANTSQGAILYLDKDPIVPVNGGTNTDGTLVGNNYDDSNFSNLQFRADLVVYFKDGYQEYRTDNGSNGWSNATTSGMTYSSSGGNVREIAIPWSVIGGRPMAYNWFGYVAYSGGGAYASVPTENPGSGGGLIIGTSATWDRYYTVSTSSTMPFSRKSYTFTSGSDVLSFGSISSYDFTMNSSGRYISRSGNVTGNWTIAGDLTVGAGTIYSGSGGSGYGTTSISGNLNILGGTFNMDQTTGALSVSGNVSVSSGATLTLSGTVGGDLSVSGNWSNSGTFNCSNRQVVFAGSTAQTLSGTNTFDYLKINNSAGVTLQASSPVTINSNLDLTSGKLTLGANNLTLLQAASATNASSTSYIVTNSSGALVKNSVGNSATSFPVGLTSSYTPLLIANTGTSNTLSLIVTSPPTNAVTDATKIVNLEWNVNAASSGAVATIDFNWNSSNQGASYSASGTGELGNFTSGSNYAITSIGTMAAQSKTVTGIALSSGNNKLVIGNTNAVYAVPSISTTGTLVAVDTTYGTASANTSFSVSGTNLSSNISINPPAGYQISTSSTFASNVGTNGAPLTLTPTSGTVSAITIYVRIPSTTAVGDYSGNIALTSTGATSVNVPTVSSTVSAVSPTIGTFNAITKNYGDADFTLTAPSSNSGGAFTYSSSNASVATISGTTVTIVGAGTSTITATQAANGNYSSGSTTTTLTVNTISPTIGTFNAITKNYGDADFTLTAPSSNSGGAFTYSSSNASVATISGTTVTIVGAGTSTITASQAADGNYSSGSTTTTLTVNSIAPLITTSGTLTPFNSCTGIVSAEQNFSVSGSNLTSNITVTAPSGYELSLTSNSSFADTVTLIQNSSTVATTTVYVRLKNNASNGDSGNIVCSSTNANTVNVSTDMATVGSPPVATSNALNFDGVDDKVTLNSNLLASTSELTYELWIKPTAISGVLLAHESWNNGYVHFQFHGSQIGFDIYGGNDNIFSYVFNSNTWYHVAAVYSASAHTLKFYVNGILQETITNNSFPSIVGNEPITMASWNNDRYYNGIMDEVRIWNIARTDAQIQAAMNSELSGNETGLVAYFNFNQGNANGNNTSINSLINNAGNNNSGTINNMALTGTSSNFVEGVLTNHTIPAMNQALCVNGAATALTSNLSGGSGLTYQWYSNITSINSGGILIANATSSNFTPPTTIAGTKYYYVVATNSSSCESTSSSSGAITVNALPSIALASSALTGTYDTNSQTTSISYSGTIGNPINYSINWNVNPSNSFVAVTNASLSSSPISIAVPAGANTGTYTGILTVKNAANCISTNNDFTYTIALNNGDITPPTILHPISQNNSGNSTIKLSENTSGVTIYSASENVTWLITGGSEASLFNINSSTGLLTFINPPFYSSPQDTELNNSYVVEISATDDSANVSTQTLTVIISPFCGNWSN